eukprot:3422004-Amphidinium_carterae.1
MSMPAVDLAEIHIPLLASMPQHFAWVFSLDAVDLYTGQPNATGAVKRLVATASCSQQTPNREG